MLMPSAENLEQVTALRQRLIDRGYEPVAVATGGKAPVEFGWQRRPPSTSARAGSLNTGLRCGAIIAVDIDIDDPREVDEAVGAVEAVALPTPLIRGRESAPRTLLVYRAGEAMKKRILRFGSGKLEFLATGQQFVSHGTHPCGDTFLWREMAPEDVDPSDLPVLSSAHIDEIARRLGADPEPPVPPEPTVPTTTPTTATSDRDVAGDRERAWAKAALDKLVDDVAATPEGSRSDVLNKGAFRLGGMLARGWLTHAATEQALRVAVAGWADQKKTINTIRRGLRDGQKTPHADLADDAADPAVQERRNRLAEELDAATSPAAVEVRKPAKRNDLTARPFVWCDPATIERRRWLYDWHYIRRFVSATIAPGGVGKSTLVAIEALAMATSEPLLGIHPNELCRVWLWQGEDPIDEMQRRLAAAMLRFDIAPSDVEGWLFVNSGRDNDLCIATQDRNGTRIAEPVVHRLIEEIRRNQIDVVIVDPFVSTHAVSENDNPAIDRVAKTWARIAHETNCAIELVHHSRKLGGQQTTVEDSRGASSLLATVRSARVLNPMTKEEAAKAGVDNPLGYVRVERGKANLSSLAESARWLKVGAQALGNGPLGTDGDMVAVLEPWRWPNPLEGMSAADLDKVIARIRRGQEGEDWLGWRESPQAAEWVGYAVAEALDIDISSPAGKSRVTGMLKIWLGSGALKKRVGPDKSRRPRTFIEAGNESSE